MADPASGDISGWVQVGGVIGAILGGAILVVRGRWGEASPAITQTRQEATEVFVRETLQNREALMALRDLLSSEREILVAIKDAILRLVPIQENIARMMQEQRDSERSLAQEARLLQHLESAERERDKARRLSRSED